MSYEQPYAENLNFTNPEAAQMLAALIAGISAGADQNGARSAWLGVYPQYPVEFERALALHVRVSGEGKADAIRRQLDAADWRDEIDRAVAQHRIAKLSDPARMAELADRFRAKTLTSSQLDTIPIPEPLIDGFIDKSSLARIYGPSRSFKSFIAFDMAQCIAEGMAWHGHETNKAKTLYVVAEGSAGSMQRTRAWERQNGIADGQAGAVIYPEAVQIKDADQMAELLAYVVVDGFELVVFDTQARCTEGVDEYNNPEMGVIVGVLDELRKKSGACVMLVHHTGNDNADRARGATAVKAAMDAEFQVKRDGNTLNVEFITRKRKDGEELEPIRLTMVKHTNIATPVGVRDSLAVAGGHVSAQHGPGVQVVTPALSAAQAGTLVALARYDEQGPTQLAVDQGMKREDRSKVGQHLTRLHALGCADKVGSKYKINEYGWNALENLRLTVGYHQVPDLEAVEDAQDEPEAA